MTTRRTLPTLVLLADSREPHPDAGDAPSALFRPSVRLPGGTSAPCVTRRVTLAEGDYGLPELTRWRAPDDPDGAPWSGLPLVVFERKTIADLWGTLFGETGTDALGEAQRNQDRFRAELARLAVYARAQIVVEGTRADLWRYTQRRAASAWERGKPWRDPPEVKMLAIMRLLESFYVDFGISVEWTMGRRAAELYIGQALERVWGQAIGGGAAKRTRERGIALPWLGALEGVEQDESEAECDRSNVRSIGHGPAREDVEIIPGGAGEDADQVAQALLPIANCPPGFHHVDPRRIGVTRKRRPKGATV